MAVTSSPGIEVLATVTAAYMKFVLAFSINFHFVLHMGIPVWKIQVTNSAVVMLWLIYLVKMQFLEGLEAKMAIVEGALKLTLRSGRHGRGWKGLIGWFGVF